MSGRTNNSRDGAKAPRPIFIHAMWRTGSTYVWKKFRDQPQYRAYYEPLNELLARPRESFLASASSKAAEKLRHPALKNFYFTEFPFTPGGGVAFFEKPLSYERYSLEPDAEDEPLYRYINNLLAHAGLHGQTPVLQFNRSVLRAGWLDRNFSPVNILVLRQPTQMWKSMLSFEDHSFTGALCILLGQNRFRPPLCHFPSWIDLPYRAGPTIDDDHRAYTECRVQYEARLYPLFFDFSVAATLHSVRYADCVLDMDELAANPAAREAASHRLKELGVAIDFADLAMPRYSLDSAVEREWLAYEEFAADFLGATLPAEFSLPKDVLAKHGPMLGSYYRDLLGKFTERPAPLSLRDPARAADRASQSHRQGLTLFHAEQYEAAAGQFARALAEQENSERWNDWATAQSACVRPLLTELGYRQALRMDSQHRDATANLGILLALQGRDSEALPLLEQAQRTAPVETNATLQRLCDEVRERMGLQPLLRATEPLPSATSAFAGASSMHGFTVFLTGLSGAGKSTLAKMLIPRLREATGRGVTLLDGDDVRTLLSSELGFSKAHRELNIRRNGFVAAEIAKHGGISVCALIAPYDAARKEARAMIEPHGSFVLVYLSTPLTVCEKRDPKGLYVRARAGLLAHFTGVSDAYEAPEDAELTIDTSDAPPAECAQKIMAYLEWSGLLGTTATAQLHAPTATPASIAS